jgi:phage host-nuclease inhibitor protein Gam
MTYEQGLAMARLMKAYDEQIKDAILLTQQAQHGVVALKFSEGGTQLRVEILDEPYQDDVRVYPGEAS